MGERIIEYNFEKEPRPPKGYTDQVWFHLPRRTSDTFQSEKLI